MPEWLMGADCKSAGYTYAGSNPARPKLKIYKLLIVIVLFYVFVMGQNIICLIQ